jgi:hypothetical protein
MLMIGGNGTRRRWVVVKVIEGVSERDVKGILAEHVHGALRPCSGDKRLGRLTATLHDRAGPRQQECPSAKLLPQINCCADGLAY